MYNLSKDIVREYVKVFMMFVDEFVFTDGQFSDRSAAAFSLSLCCSISLQSNNMLSTVCSALLQQHIGLSVTLYLYRYDLTLPCAVTIVVKFGVILIFNFNLSTILVKNLFRDCAFCSVIPFTLPLGYTEFV
jgi:hypothetical protein